MKETEANKEQPQRKSPAEALDAPTVDVCFHSCGIMQWLLIKLTKWLLIKVYLKQAKKAHRRLHVDATAGFSDLFGDDTAASRQNVCLLARRGWNQEFVKLSHQTSSAFHSHHDGVSCSHAPCSWALSSTTHYY